jgi:hypothetical protein
MSDRLEEFAYSIGFGQVTVVYEASWEVDLIDENGGRVDHATVCGPLLPNVSTPTRPQWAAYGFSDHLCGRALCWPVESRQPGTRFDRGGLVFSLERDNYRMTISKDGAFEIHNKTGDAVTRIRVEQDGPFIRFETPMVKATFDSAGNLHEIDAANIHLGKDAIEKVVLGSTFLTWLQAFIVVFNAHVHPDTGANSNHAPALPTILSEVSKTL